MNGPEEKRILVIKLGALGDFIQALGPMKAIRNAHPEAHIVLLTTRPFESLGRNCGYFDEVWTDRRPKWHDIAGWLFLRQKLNNGNFRRVYDLQNNDRTSFYFRLFSPKPEWSGTAAGASHRNASKERVAGKAFEGHAGTLAIAGITNIEVDDLSWMHGKNFEGLKPRYVLIVPGASPQHPQKRWPVPFFIHFCQEIAKAGMQPVLIGGAAEEKSAADIFGAVQECRNLCGKTSFYDIAQLARNAYGAIGNDTGPMHIIGPTGCPSLVLFSGSGNPARHAPLGKNIITLQEQNLRELKPETVWKAFCDQHASL
jgi:ADP-heptose:LPS heptosyltransferase